MKLVAVVLLSLLSVGRSAPLSSCDVLLKPIDISKEDTLGEWTLIGRNSDTPGSGSVVHLLSSLWLNRTSTSQSNVVHEVHNQKILGNCSSLAFDVIHENSTEVIEKTFYLKEVFLPTECADCMVTKQDIKFGNDSFTSLFMNSRSRSVSSAAMEMFKKQAECLGLRSPLILDQTSELCPQSVTPADGASFIQALLEDKMGQEFAKFLDSIFNPIKN